MIAATLPSDRRPLRIENENEEKKVKGEKEKTQELAAHAQVVGSLWRSSCVGWRGDRMRRRGKIDHWERGELCSSRNSREKVLPRLPGVWAPRRGE